LIFFFVVFVVRCVGFCVLCIGELNNREKKDIKQNDRRRLC